MNELANRIEKVKGDLRKRGQRVTPQRLAIIETVFQSRKHPTAQEIFEGLQERFPTMSLATVYKTLHLLEELGEVMVVFANSESTHYDGAVRPHVHLICTKCGAIVDDYDVDKTDYLRSVHRRDWQIESWRLELLGLCPNCRN